MYPLTFTTLMPGSFPWEMGIQVLSGSWRIKQMELESQAPDSCMTALATG